jgi:Barrel-sandwich domain of CusB or HlyD membrane-fusion
VFNLLVLIGLAALPLDRHVQVPSVLLPAVEAKIFAPEPSMILELAVKPGDDVVVGTVLAQLFAPEIAYFQRSAQLRLDIADARLQRIAADRKDRAEMLVVEQEKQTALAELDGLKQRGRLLVLRAPVAGKVTGDALPLRNGQWVGREDILFQIVDGHRGRLVGLLLEREAARVHSGAEVSFVPGEGYSAAVQGVVDDVGVPGGEGVALAYLSSQFGGAIAVDPSRQGRPIAGYMTLSMSTPAGAGGRAMAGTANVTAEPESLLGFMAGRVATVMLRESGF